MSLKNGTKFHRRTDVKITLWYIFTFFISVLIIFGFLYLRLKHQLIKEIDRILHDEADELSEIVSQDPTGGGIIKDFESGVALRTYYPIYFRVLKADGSLFYISKHFNEIQYNPRDKSMSNLKEGNEIWEDVRSLGRRRTFRMIHFPMYKEGKLAYVIQVATHTHFVRKSSSDFEGNLLAAFPIVLVLGSLGGWVLARRSLAPVGYIASKARSITSSNLDERLVTRGTDDEMDHLIQTINEMIARLESSFKRISEFTADASHELKNPLCALKGEAEVLLSKKRPAGEYEEGLAHFIERFDHLNRMINDLVILSKFDSSQIELERVPLRLDLLVRDIGNLFQVLAEQKKITLEMNSIQEAMVLGDKGRLQQLFTNIIDNAIKFTGEGGKIQVTVERDNEAVQVLIKDNGVGIPEEEQEKIFKRFYRVDKSRSKETGGIGLGLSIAEWIAHAHHGRIEVHSELNRGSTFTVYLPILEN
jgi:heavy metal sensor kinase